MNPTDISKAGILVVDDPAANVPTLEQSRRPRGRNELVLVVDDEFSMRDITQQILEASGYRVITASDGAEAVALCAKQPQQIDLVLTDMLMPIMDGAVLVQALKRLCPRLRVIVASGIDTGKNGGPASEADGRHFLQKPYKAATLLRLVREVLDRPASPAIR